MRVFFARAAEIELEEIGDHIALSNPDRAVSLVQELRDKCLGLADMPLGFPRLAQWPALDLGRRVHGNYVIFYRVSGENVEVLHVLHGAMDYERILFPED
jgi:plasmid stabilization system protein ParE